MNPKVISIRGDPMNGDLTVSPTYAHVDVDQEIHWRVEEAKDAAAASILIVFDDDEAFTAREPEKGVGERPTVETRSEHGVARARAKEPGLYHYRLAVCIDGHVYADMWCPTVVVR